MQKISYTLGDYSPYMTLFTPTGTDITQPLPALLVARGCCPSKSQVDWYDAAQLIADEAKCITAVFDYRGSGENTQSKTDDQLTLRDHIDDITIAYDQLAAQPTTDERRISVYGNSYGSDLAIRLSAVRRVHGLRLGVPGLYADEHLDLTIPELMRDEERMIEEGLATTHSQLLTSLAQFSGPILIVEHERDSLIPKEMVNQVIRGAKAASSLHHEVIQGADHWLETDAQREQASSALAGWLQSINQ